MQQRLAANTPVNPASFDPARPVRQAVEAYEAFCAECEMAPAEVALAWLLHQPAVTAPIIGPRTIQQLRTAQRSVDVHLDKAMLDRLDEIWPGPGGPAPEAYAW